MRTLPIDHVTDCNDMCLLCVGSKGIPTDKSQRLTVLALREDRLTGRIRRMFLYPTQCVLCDALTKPGTFMQFMTYMTSGFFEVTPPKDRHIAVREITRVPPGYSEHDLITLAR